MLQDGQWLKMKLLLPTLNAFRLQVECTSPDAPLSSFTVVLAAESTDPVNVDVPLIGNVGSDINTVVTCRPDPALYPTRVPDEARLFKSDVLIFDAVLKNNQPPESGLDTIDGSAVTISDLQEDGASVTQNILSFEGRFTEVGELDPDGTVVTFSLVCNAARGTFEWEVDADGAFTGNFTYTPAPDAFGLDAIGEPLGIY